MITCCCRRRRRTLILTRCSSVRHFEYFNQNSAEPLAEPALPPRPPPASAPALAEAPRSRSLALYSPGARQGAREAGPPRRGATPTIAAPLCARAASRPTLRTCQSPPGLPELGWGSRCGSAPARSFFLFIFLYPPPPIERMSLTAQARPSAGEVLLAERLAALELLSLSPASLSPGRIYG